MTGEGRTVVIGFPVMVIEIQGVQVVQVIATSYTHGVAEGRDAARVRGRKARWTGEEGA